MLLSIFIVIYSAYQGDWEIRLTKPALLTVVLIQILLGVFHTISLPVIFSLVMVIIQLVLATGMYRAPLAVLNFVLIAPWTGYLNLTLGYYLRLAYSTSISEFLTSLTIPHQLIHTVVVLGDNQFVIDYSCSGVNVIVMLIGLVCALHIVWKLPLSLMTPTIVVAVAGYLMINWWQLILIVIWGYYSPQTDLNALHQLLSGFTTVLALTLTSIIVMTTGHRLSSAPQSNSKPTEPIAAEHLLAGVGVMTVVVLVSVFLVVNNDSQPESVPTDTKIIHCLDEADLSFPELVATISRSLDSAVLRRDLKLTSDISGYHHISFTIGLSVIITSGDNMILERPPLQPVPPRTVKYQIIPQLEVAPQIVDNILNYKCQNG